MSFQARLNPARQYLQARQVMLFFFWTSKSAAKAAPFDAKPQKPDFPRIYFSILGK
jgi:hypothetical protein